VTEGIRKKRNKAAEERSRSREEKKKRVEVTSCSSGAEQSKQKEVVGASKQEEQSGRCDPVIVYIDSHQLAETEHLTHWRREDIERILVYLLLVAVASPVQQRYSNLDSRPCWWEYM
jgi:hypothetical protein